MNISLKDRASCVNQSPVPACPRDLVTQLVADSRALQRRLWLVESCTWSRDSALQRALPHYFDMMNDHSPFLFCRLRVTSVGVYCNCRTATGITGLGLPALSLGSRTTTTTSYVPVRITILLHSHIYFTVTDSVTFLIMITESFLFY